MLPASKTFGAAMLMVNTFEVAAAHAPVPEVTCRRKYVV
jgi:hypothetical protein